jgi:hypothetical protein
MGEYDFPSGFLSAVVWGRLSFSRSFFNSHILQFLYALLLDRYSFDGQCGTKHKRITMWVFVEGMESFASMPDSCYLGRVFLISCAFCFSICETKSLFALLILLGSMASIVYSERSRRVLMLYAKLKPLVTTGAVPWRRSKSVIREPCKILTCSYYTS